MNIPKTQQRSLFRVCAFLCFALVIPSFLDGNYRLIFAPLAIAFGSLSYSYAKDAHLFPLDAAEAAKIALSSEQRHLGFLSLTCAVIAAAIWYIG
ncbi:MAG: hypothetical protein AB8B95_00965 [Pseudohongiellaceae bacterium]